MRLIVSFLPMLLLSACVDDLKPGESETPSDSGSPATEDPFAGLPASAAALCAGQTPTLPVADEDEALATLALAVPIVETRFIVDQALDLAKGLADASAGCVDLSSDPDTGATLLEASCVDVEGYTLTGSLSWQETGEGFSLEAGALTVVDPAFGTLILDGSHALAPSDEAHQTYTAQGRVSTSELEGEPKDRVLALEATFSDTEQRMAGWISVTSGLGERTGGACIWYAAGEDLDPCEESDPVGTILVGADTYEDVEECAE